MPRLILASTSRYRRELLARLQLPFEVHAPDLDESALPDETPAAMSERLALGKAHAVAQLLCESEAGDTLVIGSDQVADVEGRPVGKPGTHERAREQLREMSGRAVVFQTSVAVVRAATGFSAVQRVPVTVRFRELTDQEIEVYLLLEQPYDCAGSAKCETLGIALLTAIESTDPTALIGLPMIATCELLRRAGFDPIVQARDTSSGARPE